MSIPQSEPWLRGPVAGVPAILQPAAHAFLMSIEDCEAAVRELPAELVWVEHAGAASIGFHLRHLAGATDRLLTYARGEVLGAGQKAAMMAERAPGDPPPGAEELLQGWRTAVDRAVAQLSATQESSLLEFRGVGRAQLPSNVLGLLFHAAEHASRHTGQVITTARILKGVHC